MKQQKPPQYIPAFHFHWLTHWYDPVVRKLFPESDVKSALLAQAALQPGQVVLDMGCGTGTLMLMIKQVQPDAEVHGIDMDAAILEIAKNKAAQAGETLFWQQGSVTALPYPDASFDRVFASLMLHHLIRADRQQALREAFRVLKPGGELHVMDFGKPHDKLMWLISLVVRWLEEVYDNVIGLLPVFIAQAGFQSIEETARFRSIFGTVTLYRARKAE